MASLKYGSIADDKRGAWYPVAASQYFYHEGENMVYLDASGHVTKAVTNTAYLFGYAVVPKGRGAGSSDAYWLSSAVAGEDEIFVVTDPNALFLLPADDTVTQAMVGDACDIVAVNDGTATTVDVGTSTTDVLVIEALGTKYGGAATDVVVRINSAKRQAVT